MRFDPFTWLEVKPNVENPHKKGVLRLQCSAPAPLYITAQGVEALFGVGTAFDVEVSEAVTYRLDAPKGVRLFQYDQLPTATVASGEVFTNLDRQPHESAALQEVTRARRMLEFEKRQMIAEMRHHIAAAKKLSKPVTEPVEDDDPSAVVDAAEEQENAAKATAEPAPEDTEAKT